MDGILPLWKERGMTSHDCVFKVRKILHMKKVGHTGTLDPNVDGVLPICLGSGTKLVELLMDKTKVYTGEITFGFATTTEDLDGEIVTEQTIENAIPDETIQEAMQQLTGHIVQIPPMFSAIKVNGKRLYEYAREGIEVERPEHPVYVDAFEMASASSLIDGRQSFQFKVVCGKGTYVRTLASDLGQALGVPATMTSLTRAASTPFKQEDCLTLDQLREAVENDDFSWLVSIEESLSAYPQWHVPSSETMLHKLIDNGSVLDLSVLPSELQAQLPVTVFLDDKIKALYDLHPSKDGKIKPTKMF
ncbi:tRNA pseudouridine(55) synthase TruB [Aerococcus agrisoli]|uniref:tRNA pseudouridine synthase B n=1 Tax=Aerococcus agrisoli TaxID=2487350 RepID=A0A3N4GL32_9LACT|nr:tRNA pseudouridine(55) synthase TruB [Aerococcus agrisoli]RPA59831.1 tRNA pseudouridine(55) synthase TruB [Aerococcus agrisoli]